jgi:hypothetical protein
MLKNLNTQELMDINGGTAPSSNDPSVDLGLRIGYFIGTTIRETLKIINPFN